MADFRGNRQYVSVGNINSSNKACLFLIDYPSRQRLKIWAEAEVMDISDNPKIAEKVSIGDYKAATKRVMLFEIQAFDWNCPQHITPRFTYDEIRDGIEALDPELVRSCCPDQQGSEPGVTSNT